jgi:hypothetical protein
VRLGVQEQLGKTLVQLPPSHSDCFMNRAQAALSIKIIELNTHT